MKLDISKTYDRMECDYLQSTLSKMVLPQNLVHLIMQCVPLTSFSILFDGFPKDPIVPSRGCREGDLLSPTYFYYALNAWLIY